MSELNLLSARHAALAIRKRDITSLELVQACLDRISAREQKIHAWKSIDFDLALKLARLRDNEVPIGLLHGVPVGVKDVIDTVDWPTEYGSRYYRGYRPGRNAACVSLLHRSGGIVIGKTVTTEFAMYEPSETRNPHNAEHTPGGSSSGSAAAVADFHVPVAIGTQTSGSLIRPAAYCGVIGYKPTFGTLAIEGTKALASSLDTLGFVTRTVDDLSLMREVFLGDVTDCNNLDEPLNIAICRTPWWDIADNETHRALYDTKGIIEAAGHNVIDIELPAEFADLPDIHAGIMAFEAARNHIQEFEGRSKGFLGSKTRKVLEDGWRMDASQYQKFIEYARQAKVIFNDIAAKFDAVMVPAAPGVAPEISGTGDPIFNRVWSLLGVPAITIPFGKGVGDLPLGIQFIAMQGADRRLISTCQVMEKLISQVQFDKAAVPASER